MTPQRYRIAVLLDTSRAYDRDVLKGITHFNKLYDKFTFFFYSPTYIQPADSDKLWTRLQHWHPDGIIARETAGMDQLQSFQVPLIISPHTQTYPDCINLWADNKAIGELAARYFVEKGYKHLGFIGFKEFQWSIERQLAFIQSLQACSLFAETFLFDSQQMSWEDLPSNLGQWAQQLPKPCAVFSATDELNIHLLEAARKVNLSIPDELVLLGVDDDQLLCEMMQPTLSSIDQNAFQAGYQVAEGMLHWLDTNHPPEADFIIPPKTVVVRQSTSSLAIDDPQIRLALSFIGEHAPFKNIRVEDVIAVTHHSRRILEKKFKSQLNTSILDQIRLVRINRIKYLLSESTLTIQQIAYEMDFENPDNITRYFRQATGYSPLEYRKKYQSGNSAPLH
ncbi:XylR family transcriptional regulator [Xanthocytophaga agilis]|uniref:XylR family transcriptional regulator n=1 Tax=Xanthocytophaga agilis TaxID=3048010 RepID=A0AAE3RC11_9BACT|nr:XylR family transcriptional regulator [Xanthocytophaga agilis]MDJ1505602.1 XylR family transcriptional regulator [Xanthocytophaga agilis]